jgi:hypothetical protein
MYIFKDVNHDMDVNWVVVVGVVVVVVVVVTVSYKQKLPWEGSCVVSISLTCNHESNHHGSPMAISKPNPNSYQPLAGLSGTLDITLAYVWHTFGITLA